MAEMNAIRTIKRKVLEKGIENTYPDTKFYVFRAMDPDSDFRKGLCRYKSSDVTKAELQKILLENEAQVFTTIPEFPGKLILTPQLAISLTDIGHNQIFHTEVPEGYHHICDHNTHYEVYFRIDHATKKIAVLLGDKKKVLALQERSEYAWKVVKDKMYCMNSEYLEKAFLDPLWRTVAIRLLRRVLGVKDTV